MLHALGRREEAVEALRAALRIDPTLAWAQLELGEALRLLGGHAEALEVLDRAIELEPDNAYALGIRGQVLRPGPAGGGRGGVARPCRSTPHSARCASSWRRFCEPLGRISRPSRNSTAAWQAIPPRVPRPASALAGFCASSIMWRKPWRTSAP